MPLPRAPKLTRSSVDAADAPDWKATPKVPDPLGLGPAEPWLRLQNNPVPIRLLRRHGDDWLDEGAGEWEIHAWRSKRTAIISQDQTRLLDLDDDGTRRVLWEGPRLVERSKGYLWGGNWMFAATVLPDGRWLAIVPADDPQADPERAGRRLVLFDAAGREVAALELPERTESAVKRGAYRRFMARQLHVACGGRVVMLHDVDVLAVGVYDEALRWIGKSTMPSEGGMWTDGNDVFISSSLANTNVNWSRYEGLEERWRAKQG